MGTQTPVLFSPRDLTNLLEERKSAFDLSYWNSSIRVASHFDLVASARTPLDVRLLYDSWLWRAVLERCIPRGKRHKTLELLPGSSLTIPLALMSSDMCEEYFYVDDQSNAPFPSSVHLRRTRAADGFAQAAHTCSSHGLIVGNHIIDDLLFSLHLPDLQDRASRYRNIELCMRTWREIFERAEFYTNHLIGIFGTLRTSMAEGAILLLRHYPSTFALACGDIHRASLEMAAYRAVAASFISADEHNCGYLDVSGISVAEGSKYPDSFFYYYKSRLPGGNSP